MWTFLLTRVLQALFTLWVVSVLVFFAARLTGSPDLALLPPDALPWLGHALRTHLVAGTWLDDAAADVLP